MSSNQLPDHRPKAFRKREKYFTDDQIRALRSEFGFDPSYTLGLRLEDYLFAYFRHPRTNKPAPKTERKELITAVRDGAEVLNSALTNIGPDEFRLSTPPSDTSSRAKIVRELRNWHAWAIEALNALADEESQRGCTGLPAERELIANLSMMYEAGTGNRAGYTQASETNNYSGPFVTFAERIFEILNLPISNGLLGRTLKELNVAKRSSSD